MKDKISKAVERYEEYKEDTFDRIILLIRNGTIRCGKYANLVKIKDVKKLEGKEFFKDGSIHKGK